MDLASAVVARFVRKLYVSQPPKRRLYQNSRMSVAFLELHYHLRDHSHTMDALVRNKCEAEILAAFTHIAHQLGVEVRLESTAYREGGLKEIWSFLGTNSAQLALLLTIIVLIFSRYPTSDPEIDTLNKEVLKLTIEEKRLNLQKLRREAGEKQPSADAASDAAHVIEGDLKVATRRSNFYRGLIGYEKVTAVGFALLPEHQVSAPDEKQVQRSDFSKFVQLTDRLPVEVIDEANIEIVAPVLREGNYPWKGQYNNQPINFAMLDEMFKSSVLLRQVSFQHGSTIKCVLNIHRKFDEVGDVKITGYSVTTVLEKSDDGAAEETPQGKRYRFAKKQGAGQGSLFEQAP